MVMMPLTYNITNGIGAGFLLWTLIKILRGKFRQIHPVMYVLAVVAIALLWLEHT
jgi:AGZA family xanthine/uracil permease-like MFS transporter